MTCSVPANVAGAVHYVQREAGLSSAQSQDYVEGNKATLTREDVAWVRDCSDSAALRHEDPSQVDAAFDAVREKAHCHSTLPGEPHSKELLSGGLLELAEEEVDALFGRFASVFSDRSKEVERESGKSVV